MHEGVSHVLGYATAGSLLQAISQRPSAWAPGAGLIGVQLFGGVLRRRCTDGAGAFDPEVVCALDEDCLAGQRCLEVTWAQLPRLRSGGCWGFTT